MMMDYLLWMLWSMECNICGVKIKSVRPTERGAGSGICEGAGGITGISVEEV